MIVLADLSAFLQSVSDLNIQIVDEGCSEGDRGESSSASHVCSSSALAKSEKAE